MDAWLPSCCAPLATVVANSSVHLWPSSSYLSCPENPTLTAWPCGADTLASWLPPRCVRDSPGCGANFDHGGWELKAEGPPLLSVRWAILRSFCMVPQKPPVGLGPRCPHGDQLISHPWAGFPSLPVPPFPTPPLCSPWETTATLLTAPFWLQS